MPQRTITGPIVDAGGIALASGELHLTPTVPAGTAADGFTAQAAVYTIIDGAVEAPVIVPGHYKIELFDAEGTRLRSFSASISDASLGDITLKEVWESRAAPVNVPPAELREGDGILRMSPGGGENGDVLRQVDGELTWSSSGGGGGMSPSVYDPLARKANVYDRANHTGAQVMGTVTGLLPALAAKADLVDGTVPVSQLPPMSGDVTSVNGETGAVVLDAADVGAVGLTGNQTVAGSKTFSDDMIATRIRYHGAAGATLNTSYLSAVTGGASFSLRMWSVGNETGKANGLEVVNNAAGNGEDYVRAYVFNKIIWQCNSYIDGANSDYPDFLIRSRLTIQNTWMPASEPNVLIRVPNGHTGDCIRVMDDGIIPGTMWRVTAAGKGFFRALNISTSTPPATPTSPGTAGDVAWDTGYLHLCTSANNWKKVALGTEFTQGGTVHQPSGITGAVTLVVWRAPYACTVKGVRGYRVGGSGATINARKNGAQNHLGSDLSLTSANSWISETNVQNGAYAAGDTLEILVVSATGSPTQIAIQLDFER